MKGAPPTKHEILGQIDLIVRSVDQRGRDVDKRWGIGRLPLLVPIDLAEAFRRQQRKFSGAVWEYDAADVRKHGDAMLRAYDKLEQVAASCGASEALPEQWEFMMGETLVILVRDIADTGRVDTQGRTAQIWSLDEIASVIRNHPVLAAAKDAFPGAIVQSVRPEPAVMVELNDSLMEIPL